MQFPLERGRECAAGCAKLGPEGEISEEERIHFHWEWHDEFQFWGIHFVMVLHRVLWQSNAQKSLCNPRFAVREGMEYTVLGDAVNLAARLMANAPENGILIDESTKTPGMHRVSHSPKLPKKESHG